MLPDVRALALLWVLACEGSCNVSDATGPSKCLIIFLVVLLFTKALNLEGLFVAVREGGLKCLNPVTSSASQPGSTLLSCPSRSARRPRPIPRVSSFAVRPRHTAPPARQR